MYVAIKIIEISADQFWIVLSIMHASNAFFYYLRMKWLQAKALKNANSQLISV